MMVMSLRNKIRNERESIVLWQNPLKTLSFCILECTFILKEWTSSIFRHKFYMFLTFSLAMLFAVAYYSDNPYKEFIRETEIYLLWCAWWIGLGVLSSVGLGTGLHTFILYLGPHIAAVTLAAYECGGTNFPSPPYPNAIVCPESAESSDTSSKLHITVWEIMSKVRIEAFCWGLGTALGELPPYFMAKAHRLSGITGDESDDEETQELLSIKAKLANKQTLSYFERSKLFVEKLVEKVGFLGILACASVPNPLFDLAGITCGHFLIPFWTFFGATLIGKAIIKMHIQKLFVIMAFNESLIELGVSHIHEIPLVGYYLKEPFVKFLAAQKNKLHQQDLLGTGVPPDSNWISFIFEKFVLAMVAYFVVSIINSLAQSYHKRTNKEVALRKKAD